jgi:hypothetical protein
MKNAMTPPGIDTGTVRLVTQYLNQYATPGPLYVNIWGGSVRTIGKNTETLVVASNEVGLVENDDKTKYIDMCRDQNTA